MVINELWGPIILECVSWVTKKLGPSKKELKIQISELEKLVQTLSVGNKELIHNQKLILQAILDQLTHENGCKISADTIVFIKENSGSVDITQKSKFSQDITGKKVDFDVSKIFEGVNEEIYQSRATKPSDRR
ncbi:MAG: hypothetical protein IKB28_02005 [Clostridia bacterium]|nr:hypothetical protein [Clostridia bacterium]